MATGRLPFRGNTTAMVFDAILHWAPERPMSLNQQVTAELERIILRALEKDRSARYQHASELRAELMRLTQPAAVPPLRRPAPLRRLLVPALVGGLAAIGAVGGYLLSHGSAAPPLKKLTFT
jgi:hypothetical protein